MEIQPLENLPATSSRVRFLAQFLKLSGPAFIRSMQTAGHSPSPSSDNWRLFLERLFFNQRCIIAHGRYHVVFCLQLGGTSLLLQISLAPGIDADSRCCCCSAWVGQSSE